MRHAIAISVVVVLGLAPVPGRCASGTGPGGYTWKDCNEPGGPPCAYTITATDDGSTGLCTGEIYDDPGDSLGFPFPFYGANRGDYEISANGVIYLTAAPGCCDDANVALTGTESRAFIAVLWDDWAMDNLDGINFICRTDPECSNTGPLSGVESFQRGDGVELGVEYKEFGWYSTAHHRPTCTEDFGQQATFGVRLYADGRILMQYLDTDLGLAAVDHGASATIGVTSGSGGSHTQFSFDLTGAIPQNPYSILFEPGCSPLSCTRVRVTPEPACEGIARTLTAEWTGGDGVVDVAWDTDGDTVPDATGNPLVLSPGAGFSSVTAILTDECARPAPATCQVAGALTTHPLPAPVIAPLGGTSFCAADGESVTLDGGAFTAHRWQRNGIDVPGATGRTHAAAVTGSWTVVVTDSNGCTGTSAPIAVDAEACTVTCSPLACLMLDVRPDPACGGDELTMTVGHGGGEGSVTVGWDLDGDTVVDLTGNPVRVVVPEGVRTVTAHVADTCGAPGPQSCSIDALVRVLPRPRPGVDASGPTSFCALRGESVTLDAGPGWTQHQWLYGGADLPGATSRQLVATVSGDYSVRVVDADGCSGTSAVVAVVANDCASPCATLACGAIGVTPAATTCEGTPQTFEIDVTGGEGALLVAWDFDGDTVVDAAGNPVTATLGPGAVTVVAAVADSCTIPGAQTCSSSVPVDVQAGASALVEVSGPTRRPLRLDPTATRVTVDRDPAATAYNAYVDAIGSWYAPSPATGSACAITTWTVDPGGTITFDHALPADTWILVTSSNACGEGPVGTDSLGGDRLPRGTWAPCGPAP